MDKPFPLKVQYAIYILIPHTALCSFSKNTTLNLAKNRFVISGRFYGITRTKNQQPLGSC